MGVLGLIPLIEHNRESLHHVTHVFIVLFGVYAGFAMLFLLVAFVVYTTLALSSTKAAMDALQRENEMIEKWKGDDPEGQERLAKSGSLRPENTPNDSRRTSTKTFLQLASFLGWGTTRTSRTSVGHIKQFFVVFFSVLALSLCVVCVLGTLYSDWVLGIVSDNLIGVGHGKKNKGLAAGWFLASVIFPW